MAPHTTGSDSGGVRRVAVVGGNRIPFARADGAYARATNHDLLGAALDGLIDRFDLQGSLLGEVAAGGVLKHSRDFNLTREVVLGSRLDSRTPAYDIQQACGTGLEATLLAANKIALGQLDSAVAGGTDTVSDAPLGINNQLRRLLLATRRARSTTRRAALLSRLRPSHLVPETPRNVEPRTGLSMGEHAARTALDWNIDRAAQDALAAESHHRLDRAYRDGFFSDLVTPYQGLTRDEILRPDTSVDKLATLKPVFGEGDNATMTAGNSSPLSDGAATVLLASEEWAHSRGLPVLAYLTCHRTAAVDYVHGQDGLLTAPTFAVPRLLADAGVTLQELDLVEIHEAFASQVLATLRAWEDPDFCTQRLQLSGPLGTVDRDRLNVTGSSLAVGHPFAATGARIVATLATLLAQRSVPQVTAVGNGTSTTNTGKDSTAAAPARGLISICAAGGQGVTALLESA